ncbi:hypothetical protein C4J98_2749 [Pseudomonas orientalis]|uniref:hypothetical protein n=1 Tax=Pseudomonas orientalis TaxID=76758 RepID=UPI000F56E573|nr:hypothetical protein [Pseudomonas orientalis]AZE84160.1 hypothetical protein C4J98_2749 [Pseudomonas orientalis]
MNTKASVINQQAFESLAAKINKGQSGSVKAEILNGDLLKIKGVFKNGMSGRMDGETPIA